LGKSQDNEPVGGKGSSPWGKLRNGDRPRTAGQARGEKAAEDGQWRLARERRGGGKDERCAGAPE